MENMFVVWTDDTILLMSDKTHFHIMVIQMSKSLTTGQKAIHDKFMSVPVTINMLICR